MAGASLLQVRGIWPLGVKEEHYEIAVALLTALEIALLQADWLVRFVCEIFSAAKKEGTPLTMAGAVPGIIPPPQGPGIYSSRLQPRDVLRSILRWVCSGAFDEEKVLDVGHRRRGSLRCSEIGTRWAIATRGYTRLPRCRWKSRRCYFQC